MKCASGARPLACVGNIHRRAPIRSVARLRLVEQLVQVERSVG